MRYLIPLALLAFAATATADPDYRTIRMQVEVNKPAAEVWAKVGGFCDISQWLDIDCKLLSGDGAIGTVRSLADGRIVEIMVGKTELSYGYTQPAKPGTFYNLYHGYLEAKPLTRRSSKIIYTLFYDASDQSDEAAKQADMVQRRTRFQAALNKMKQIAER